MLTRLGPLWVGLAFGLGVGLVARLASAQDAAASTAVAVDTSSATEAQLMVTQLYTDDDLTARHLHYSEVRGLLDTDRLFGVKALGLHFDGRFRRGWTADTRDLADVVRAYGEYGGDGTTFRFALGRMTMPEVASARIDGARLGMKLGSTLFSLFGGLTPHPYTGAIDPRFVTGGASYEHRSLTLNHGGGGAIQLYGGLPDRIYFSERAYVVISPEWMLYGLATVDLLSPRGYLGDINKKPAVDQSALERLDLTQLFGLVRFRPSRTIDFSLNVTHFHTILPNRWWTDYLEEERVRRGFAIDGLDPIGTRRSSARLVTNVHLGDLVTPYLTLRYDRRHVLTANGFEATVGVKLTPDGTSYADIALTQRRFFESDSQLASLMAGTMIGDALTLDAQAMALRTRPLAGEVAPIVLYDAGATVGLELGPLSEALSGLRVMGAYQAFIEPEIFYHVVFLQVGYRVRG